MKTILHLCADTGSDTWPYRQDPAYEVITIGAAIGVENYRPDRPIHGVIANPVCTDFSHAKIGGYHPTPADPERGMTLVRECLRVIEESVPQWWALENPSTGLLARYLGQPQYSYEPWWYGSGWTKRTGLWGSFAIPPRTFDRWDDVPKLDLYIRPPRKNRTHIPRPGLVFQHKSAFDRIPEFNQSGMPAPTTDAELRSLCSQKFAAAFKAANP